MGVLDINILHSIISRINVKHIENTSWLSYMRNSLKGLLGLHRNHVFMQEKVGYQNSSAHHRKRDEIGNVLNLNARERLDNSTQVLFKKIVVERIEV